MRQYLFVLLTHITLTYSLNCFNKVWQCAFIFVLVSILTNFIAFSYNAKKAVQTVCFSTFISLILSLNKTYFIYGKPIEGLFLVAYFSVLVSCALSAILFSFLTKHKGISLFFSSFLSILLAIVLDGFVMAGFFTSLYSPARVVDIFVREVGFKLGYAGIIYGILKGLSILPKTVMFLKTFKRSYHFKN